LAGHTKDGSHPGIGIHSRALSQPLPSHQKAFESSNLNSTTPTHHHQPNRVRAPSDPFLDAPNPRLLGSSSTSSHSHSHSPELLLASVGTDGDDQPAAPTPFGESPFLHGHTSSHDDTTPISFDDTDEEQYMRVWTSPDLADPEILQLLKLFPAFVSRRPLPRFPVPMAGHAAHRHVDIEEGEGEEEGMNLDGRTIHFGTGSMWVSSKRRSDSWEGGWWTRFVMWWRGLFC